MKKSWNILSVFVFMILLSFAPYIQGALTTRSDVDEGQTAKVSCANSEEVIESIEAYYYCSENVQTGIWCSLPEESILGKLSSYSFTFNNVNCGFDPCVNVKKKGTLLIECASVNGKTTSQTNSSEETESGKGGFGGFGGFVKGIIIRIIPTLGTNSSESSASTPVESQTEEEKAINAVLENDLEAIRNASKPLSLFAIDQYAFQNEDISVCGEGTAECAEKVLFFSCSEDVEKLNKNSTDDEIIDALTLRDLCEGELLDELLEMDELSLSPLSGKRLYIQAEDNNLNRYKFENSEIPSEYKDKGCVIDHRVKTKGWFFGLGSEVRKNYGLVFSGTILPYTSLNPWKNYLGKSFVCDSIFCESVFDNAPGSVAWTKDCGEVNCAVLSEEKAFDDGKDWTFLRPKGDLLCGEDNNWYLCDEFGILELSSTEKYLCTGDKWIKIKNNWERIHGVRPNQVEDVRADLAKD